MVSKTGVVRGRESGQIHAVEHRIGRQAGHPAATPFCQRHPGAKIDSPRYLHVSRCWIAHSMRTAIYAFG